MNQILEFMRNYWYYLALWDLLWRGIALWRAGRTNQPVWFVALLVINTIGILPLVFLLTIDKAEFFVTLRSRLVQLSKPAKKK